MGLGAPLPGGERRSLSAPLLLYDGGCGVCARSVQFLLRRDRRRKTLRFASLDSPLGRDLTARHSHLAGVDSVIWFDAWPTGPDGASPDASAFDGPSPGASSSDASSAGAPSADVPPASFPRIRSDAALAALRYLGGGWALLARVFRLVPRAVRDGVYRWVARNRHRLSRTEACLLPTVEERARFLAGPDAPQG